MTVLDDIKALKGFGDEKNNEANIYIRRACTKIKNYLNLPQSDTTDISTVYQDAVVAYVIEQYSRKGNEGIKQFTQGSRSGTFTDDLSEDVKGLLPQPYVRMMG